MQCHFAHAQQEVWKQSWHYWDNFYFQKVKTTHWVHRTTCFRHLWAQSRRRHICLSLRVFLSPCKDMRDCILALSVAVQAYGGPVSTWWTGNIRLYIAFLLSGPFYFCVSFSVKHLVAVVVLMWNWCKQCTNTCLQFSDLCNSVLHRAVVLWRTFLQLLQERFVVRSFYLKTSPGINRKWCKRPGNENLFFPD